jgi:1,4-dihydroxy-2-naphthoyl-CoA hydrolase
MGTEPAAPDFTEAMNAGAGGWNRAMGLRFVRATADEVVGELLIGPEHLQPHGIVHGGVYAGVVETVASVGAGLSAGARGFTAVGLENHTSFLRAVRSGTLRAVARPLTRGRRTQVWEASVTDDAGRVAATGRVRLLCIEPGSELAGEKAGTLA